MNIRFLCFDQFFMLFYLLLVCLLVFMSVSWLARVVNSVEIYFLYWALVCAFSGVSVCPKFLRNLNLFCVFLSPFKPYTPALWENEKFFMRVVLFWQWKKSRILNFPTRGSFSILSGLESQYFYCLLTFVSLLLSFLPATAACHRPAQAFVSVKKISTWW